MGTERSKEFIFQGLNPKENITLLYPQRYQQRLAKEMQESEPPIPSKTPMIEGYPTDLGKVDEIPQD